ncbi:MAG: DUF3108 domain-containing protein [Bacteroidales bacterium]|nr:DUF3108 domain-containing protein [Bacteroidales bacterium]
MNIPVRFLQLFIPLALACSANAQSSPGFEYRKVENNAWEIGETLHYRVYYESLLTGQINAGTAEIEIKKSNKKFDGREVVHIVGIGKSNRTFDFFFKVRDRFESFVDKESLAPHHFIRRTKEGGYVRDDDVDFDHAKGIAKSRKKSKTITPYVQDILSATYYARTLNADTLKVGDNISVNYYLDDSLYISVIQFQGREIVETSLGVFRCLAFKPMVATGEVFSNPYPMTLWITDDENKIPVLAESAVIVGSVKMELTEYSNLKNPVESRVKKR